MNFTKLELTGFNNVSLSVGRRTNESGEEIRIRIIIRSKGEPDMEPPDRPQGAEH